MGMTTEEETLANGGDEAVPEKYICSNEDDRGRKEAGADMGEEREWERR